MKKIKMFFIRFLVILLAVQGAVAAQLLTLPTVQAADSTPEVVINEVMWMGSYEGTTAHTNDEWIELKNTTDVAIDISGWLLTNTATSGATLTVPAGSSVAAQSYFLISNYDADNISSVLNIAPDWTTASVALSNTCGQIELLSDSLTTVDSMGCKSDDTYFAGLNDTSANIRRSMERNTVIADGALASSWQTSANFVNLDAGVAGSTFASPKAPNGTTDITPPIAGQVIDDGQYNSDPYHLNASWSGFEDPESGIVRYEVGVGTAAGSNDILALSDMGLNNDITFDFTGSPLAENVPYYINVVATNGAGLTTLVSSNGITVDTQNPATPTLTVIDTPNDNGGSVTVSYSTTSQDEIAYALRYKKMADPDVVGSWTILPATANTSAVVNGLETGIDYDFEVVAIDFNNQHSATVTTIGQALDNLVPVLNKDKVTIEQNRPGQADSVLGLAGAVSEPSKVNVLDADSKLITSINSDPDGSFTKVDLGDNKYGTFKIQLADLDDLTGLVSAPEVFTNDIVSPNAPTLEKLTSTCENEETCRVVLTWKDGGPDTDHYQVGYTATGEVEKRTFDLTSTSVTLDLANGKSYDFVIYAFDKAHNESAKSNAIFHALSRGVNTVISLVSGQLVTESTAVPASTAISETALPETSSPLEFKAPTTKAAEPTETPKDEAPVTTETKAAQQDWLRIFVVVVLLLIVASGFYALSRSFKDSPELENEKPVTPPAAKAKTKKSGTSNGNKRPKRRPRR